MKILAFMKYGDRAATTRQRLLQFLPALRENGIEVEYLPLLGNAHMQRLSDGRTTPPGEILASYAARVRQLLTRRDFDVLWIHAELFPYWPGIFERLAFLSGKPVVYDCDDAIFHAYDSHRLPLVRTLLGKKLEPLLRRVAGCICGNTYLKAYAENFNDNCIVIPTVVDAAAYLPAPERNKENTPPVIGWIGSPSTWAYVAPVLPVVQEIAQRGGAKSRIVGAGAQTIPAPHMDFIPWTQASEIAEVQKMDIGIMPLPDDPWARGKCGYKLIQYMACGLPVVASPVGVNTEIVHHGENGFLATTPAEWRGALLRLIEDSHLRQRMGAKGRVMVESRYSLQAQAPRLAAYLHSLAAQKYPLEAPA